MFVITLPWAQLLEKTPGEIAAGLICGVFPFGEKRYLLRSLVATFLLYQSIRHRKDNNCFSKKQFSQFAVLFSGIATLASCYSGCGTITALGQVNCTVFFLLQALCFYVLGYADAVLIGRCGGFSLKRERSEYWNRPVIWIRRQSDILISSGVVGLMCYAWMMTNHTLNYDGIYHLFGKGETISSGRWGLFLLKKLVPDYTLPWLWGTASILLLAIGICVLTDMFYIHNRALRCALAGLIVASSAEVDTMLFMFTSLCYALSLLLTILASALAVNAVDKKLSGSESRLMILAALGLEVFSLGVYQAYVSVISGIFLTLMLISLARGEKTFEVLEKGIIYLAFLGLSMCIYYVIAKSWMRATGTEYNWYAQSVLGDHSGILERIDYALSFFVSIFDSH